MKNKNVLILAGFVLVLGLYAYFGEYKREIREMTEKETAAKIITLNRDQVNKLVVDKLTSKIVLEKSTDGWNVVEPIRDQADNEVIEAFLDQAFGEKSVDLIGGDSSIKWEEYALVNPMGHLIFETNLGQQQRITVSTRKNFEGLVYLRRDQENRILTSSAAWQNYLSNDVNYFRNLKVFRFQVSKVDGVIYQNPKTRFEIKHKEGEWIAPVHPDWKLDQNAIREILTQTSVTKGLGLNDKKPKGSPLMSLEFLMEKERWQGQFYKESAVINPPSLNLRMAPEALSKLRDLKLVELRDKTVPFKFQRDLISKIHVKNPLKSFQLVKVNDQWQLEKPDLSLTVDSLMAQNFIERIHRLEVYQYADNAPFASTPMNSEIQLLDEKNKIIFQLNWSEFKKNAAYARTNLLSEIFKIDDAQMNRLMEMKVVNPKADKVQQEKK